MTTVPLLERLEPPLGALEGRYRALWRTREQRPALVFVAVVGLFVLANLARGLGIEGLSEWAEPVQMLRGLVAVASLGVCILVPRVQSHRVRDGLYLLWALLLVLLAHAATQVSGSRGSGSGVAVFFVLAMYLFLPIGLGPRTLVAVIGSLAALRGIFDPLHLIDDGVRLQYLAAIVFANAIGFWASVQLYRTQRIEFLERARATGADDEADLLGRLLPLCPGCESVRSEAGYWEEVFVYLRDRAGLAASHGICPDCMARVEADLDREGL